MKLFKWKKRRKLPNTFKLSFEERFFDLHHILLLPTNKKREVFGRGHALQVISIPKLRLRQRIMIFFGLRKRIKGRIIYTYTVKPIYDYE